MQAIWLARIFFALVATWSGYWIGQPYGLGPQGCIAAFFISLFVVALEYSATSFSSKKVLLAALGGFFGLALARLLHDTIPWPVVHDPASRIPLTVFNLFFLYFGVVLALRHSDRLSLSQLRLVVANPRESVCLLDTNVIIDGRIRQLYSLGFMQRRAIVPQFILNELQTLADSSDPKRRRQGRRGLEHLEQLKKVHPLLEISEKDFPEIREVDQKLLVLTKELDGVMMTNDYNLEKVAAIHQVKVLNLNELASVLRPAIHVGEELTLTVLREGKDPCQGIGYLEDGTMVVIDEGLSHIGKQVRVGVTSILHTSAGRMVFSRIVPDGPSNGAADDEADSSPALSSASRRAGAGDGS